MKKAGLEPTMRNISIDLQSTALTNSAIFSKVRIAGFEPTNARAKNECLTIWLYSNDIETT